MKNKYKGRKTSYQAYKNAYSKKQRRIERSGYDVSNEMMSYHEYRRAANSVRENNKNSRELGKEEDVISNIADFLADLDAYGSDGFVEKSARALKNTLKEMKQEYLEQLEEFEEGSEDYNELVSKINNIDNLSKTKIVDLRLGEENSEEISNIISDRYHNLRNSGVNSIEARKIISREFYGS